MDIRNATNRIFGIIKMETVKTIKPDQALLYYSGTRGMKDA